MDRTAEKEQARALQGFAIAAAERRRALDEVRRAESQMAHEQKEACRRQIDALRVLEQIALNDGEVLTHPESGAAIELSAPEDRLSFIAGGLSSVIAALEAERVA
jgi:hypothetical protein